MSMTKFVLFKLPIVAAFLLLATTIFAQTYTLSPPPKMQFIDGNGAPIVGGLLYTYAAGTTTPIATYKDSSGTVNTNPIILDANGEADIWLQTGIGYKFVLNDPNNVPIWSVDNIKNSQISTYQDVVALWSLCTSPSTMVLYADGVCRTPVGGGNISADPPNYLTGASLVMSLGDYPTTGHTGVQSASIAQLHMIGNAGSFTSYWSMVGGEGFLNVGANANAAIGWTASSLSDITGGLLYKLDSLGRATLAATTDTQIPLFIGLGAVDGSTSAILAVGGTAFCTFDGASTPGHYVQASGSVAGNCHDSGIAPPLPPPSDVFTLGTVTESGGVYINGNFRGAGTIGGSGTVGFLPLWTGSSTLSNSYLQEVNGALIGPDYLFMNDTTVTSGSNLTIWGTQSESVVGGTAISQFLFTSGTTTHRLVKLGISGASPRWVAATTSDTAVPTFPVVATKCFDSGSTCYVVQRDGIAQVDDDSTGCTPGNAVVASTSSAAKAHDTGSAVAPIGTFQVGVCVGHFGSPVVDTVILGSVSNPAAAVYNTSGTLQAAAHTVVGSCTLGTSCSITLTGASIFSSSSSYSCAATDETSAAAVKFAPSSGSAFALTGTGTDVLSFTCIGN